MATATKEKKPKSLKALREHLGEVKNEMKELIDKRGHRESDWAESDEERFEVLVNESKEARDEIKMHTEYNSVIDWQGANGDGAQLINPAQPGAEQAREIMFRTNSGVANYAPVSLDNEDHFDPILINQGYERALAESLAGGETGAALAKDVHSRMMNADCCPEGTTPGSFSKSGVLTSPTQWVAGILACCDKVTKMRQYATIFTVAEACNLGVTKRTKRTESARWGGVCKVPTCDAPEAGAVFLQPHILTACTAWCREIQRNTTTNIADWYSMEAARDVNELMENGYLYGTGIGQPLGLFSEGAINTDRYLSLPADCTVNNFVDFLIDMICNIPDCFSGGNLAWMMSKQMKCCIMKMRTDNGLWLGQAADRGIAGRLATTLFGDDIISSEFIKGTPGSAEGTIPISYGDFSQYWIADKNGMLIEREDCPGEDRTAIYTRMWTGGIPMCDEAFSMGIVTS